MSRINALYVRVSTLGQTGGMESQIRALKTFAKEMMLKTMPSSQMKG